MCHRNRGGHPNIQHGGHGRQDLTDPNSPSRNTTTPDGNIESGTDMNKRWVVNLSSQPLTEVETKLLAHGPNFAVTSRSPPTIECVTAIEEVCQKLEQGEAEELRVEVKAILKKFPPPKPNITREEQKVMVKLRKDDTRIVLTVDKGLALVVMNKEDCEKKAEELLSQTTYNNINNDPTTRYKNKLISLLKTIKTQGGISEALYKKLYPTGAGDAKFYGLPKIHKKQTPLRPIVSSIGSVSYATSRELARILKLLVGRPHTMFITTKTS